MTAGRYEFGPRMSAILSDLDCFTERAVLAGWTSVLHDLRQARHLLEGVGAVTDGQTLALRNGNDADDLGGDC